MFSRPVRGRLALGAVLMLGACGLNPQPDLPVEGGTAGRPSGSGASGAAASGGSRSSSGGTADAGPGTAGTLAIDESEGGEGSSLPPVSEAGQSSGGGANGGGGAGDGGSGEAGTDTTTSGAGGS